MKSKERQLFEEIQAAFNTTPLLKDDVKHLYFKAGVQEVLEFMEHKVSQREREHVS
ncbi:TPA: hypothetical protein I8303_001858 [Aeromonas hydrophila]|uniref:hypothetical protein n=1 Tax=Aeromonas hydrophila TaxID=644 RepID=UPI001A1A0C26|nr:hypothetical protein [Aeromonas hydrophila]